MHYEIRPRTNSEILGDAFGLFRDHFWTFLGCTALILIPSAVIKSVVGAIFEAGPFISKTLLVFFSDAVTCLLRLVLTAVGAQAMLGQRATLGGSFRLALPVLGWAILASLLTFVGIGAGLLLLIVPGILLGLCWCLYIPVIVVERLRPVAALKRSAFLTKGLRGRLFLLLAIILAIGVLPTLTVVVVAEWVGHGVPVLGTIASVLEALFATIGYAYFASVMTLIYFDAVARKDAAVPVPAPGAASAVPAPTLQPG